LDERRDSRARPDHRDHDREHPHEREAESGVEREPPAELGERRSEQDGPEEHERDTVEHASHFFGELVDLPRVSPEREPERHAGDECGMKPEPWSALAVP
jgi:hypothetical protein